MLFAMALMMGIGGLMVTAQVAPMAKSLKIAAAAGAALGNLNPLANGGGRLFWGWVSDHIGRERTMFIAFLLQSVFLLSVVTIGQRIVDAVSSTFGALVFFTWGEVYSLLPSAMREIISARATPAPITASSTAQRESRRFWAAAVAAKLFEKTGSWDYGFYICAGLALIAALMTLVLRKMPRPHKSTAGGRVPPWQEDNVLPRTENHRATEQRSD